MSQCREKKKLKNFTDKIGELEIWKMKFGGKTNPVTRDFFSFFARHTVYVMRERERERESTELGQTTEAVFGIDKI